MRTCTIILMVACSVAGASQTGAFTESIHVPLAVTIDRVGVDRIPLSGAQVGAEIVLHANVAGIVTFDCATAGSVGLSSPGALPQTLVLEQGETRSIQVSLTLGTASAGRIDFFASMGEAPPNWSRSCSRSLSFVPEQRASALTPKIGVYFDQDALTHCLPDSTTYPFIAPAYLVLTDCPSTETILGWECQLSWSEQISLSLVSLAGQALSISSFPSFCVGLFPGLSGGDAVTLATLNVLALAPGEIVLEGLGISDPSGYAVIQLAGESEPTRVALAFEAANHSVASVGPISCPPATPRPFTVYDSAAPATDSTYAAIRIARRVAETPSSKGGTTMRHLGISGQIAISNNSLGVYGAYVELWLVDTTQAEYAFWHPVWAPSLIEHVHYDYLDAYGNYSFDFSFEDSQWYSNFDEIWIQVACHNAALHMPAPADGWISYGTNGPINFLNEASGVVVPIDHSVYNLIIAADGQTDPGYGTVLRNGMLSRDLAFDVYGGSPPFSVPSLSAVLTSLGGEAAGIFTSCNPGDPYIRIDSMRGVNPMVVAHEFGHYVHYRIWNGYCDDAWSSHAEAAMRLKEGWAMFYSQAARSMAAAKYNDRSFYYGYFGDTELAPYRSDRYDVLSYHTVCDGCCAFASYLWSIYDSAGPSLFEPDDYLGDNDDVGDYRQRVFESLRTMSHVLIDWLPVNFHLKFTEGLPVDVQYSADHIIDFMFEDLNHVPTTIGMRSVQAADFTAKPIHTGRVEFSWNGRKYAQWHPYVNYPQGYRVLRYEAPNWVEVVQASSWATGCVYEAPSIEGTYRLTAFNGFGNSCSPREVSTSLTGIPDGIPAEGIQAFPNPFNAGTEIVFVLAKAQEVAIDVFAVDGSLVARLYRGVGEIGRNSVTWHGRDMKGRIVSSGTYFCRLQMLDGTVAIKLLLVK